MCTLRLTPVILEVMNENTLTWKIIEHRGKERSSDWYWVIGIITVSLAIAVFILGNMLLAIIILLAVGTLLFGRKRVSVDHEYEISNKGLRIDNTLYPWETLASFWVSETTDPHTKEISHILVMTSQKPLVPRFVIPLGNTISPENIRAVLTQTLEEEPQFEPLAHRLIHHLGF